MSGCASRGGLLKSHEHKQLSQWAAGETSPGDAPREPQREVRGESRFDGKQVHALVMRRSIRLSSHPSGFLPVFTRAGAGICVECAPIDWALVAFWRVSRVRLLVLARLERKPPERAAGMQPPIAEFSPTVSHFKTLAFIIRTRVSVGRFETTNSR